MLNMFLTELERTVQSQVTRKEIEYVEQSDYIDPRTKFIIRILNWRFKFLCCGSLVNYYEFIAPTNCIKFGGYYAYIQTNDPIHHYDLKEITYESQCKSVISKDLMIAMVSCFA